jgi:hypothetical protein
MDRSEGGRSVRDVDDTAELVAALKFALNDATAKGEIRARAGKLARALITGDDAAGTLERILQAASASFESREIDASVESDPTFYLSRLAFEKLMPSMAIGATSPLADSVQYPALVNNTIGTKFKVVPGYSSNATAQLALEKHEVDGLQNSYSAMIGKFRDWREKMNVPVQFALSRHPQMQDIPLIFDVIKPEYAMGGLSVDDIKKLWSVILVQQEMGRSFGVGPGVPPERVAALRTAFKQTYEDPQLRADADKEGLEVSPRDGGAIQQTVINATTASPETIKRLQDLTQYKGK